MTESKALRVEGAIAERRPAARKASYVVSVVEYRSLTVRLRAELCWKRSWVRYRSLNLVVEQRLWRRVGGVEVMRVGYLWWDYMSVVVTEKWVGHMVVWECRESRLSRGREVGRIGNTVRLIS